MEQIIISIFCIIILAVLAIIYKINTKKLKQIIENAKLNELTNKYPSNIEICKEILKKLNNEKVKIEENTQAKSSLYIAITDKIQIANIKNSYTRILTIAHECGHSIQDRTILIFNFIYSNIYILYFIITSILMILNKISNKMLFLNILIILSFVYYFIRAYLEDDAIIRSEYIAKQYIEEKNILSNEETKNITSRYNEFNKMVLKTTNYMLLSNCIIKIIIFSIISI